MANEINRMYFSKEDIEAGLMHELLVYLCRYSYASGPRRLSHYNDIHIYPCDCEAFEVEWSQSPWSHDYGGHFEYVGEEQVVCNEVIFPDGHYEYTPESEDEAIKIWLEDNPNWYKDNYGHWHCQDEHQVEEGDKAC